MATLLHFTAVWASSICSPHRDEVSRAANDLGMNIQGVDVDAKPDVATYYEVLNVPAVAIEGSPESLVVGAATAEVFIERLGGRSG